MWRTRILDRQPRGPLHRGVSQAGWWLLLADPAPRRELASFRRTAPTAPVACRRYPSGSGLSAATELQRQLRKSVLDQRHTEAATVRVEVLVTARNGRRRGRRPTSTGPKPPA